MSLLDDIRANETHSGSTCSMAAIEAVLTKEQREAMWEAKAERIQYKAIARWLQGLGHPAKSETVARHMRGDCRCRR